MLQRAPIIQNKSLRNKRYLQIGPQMEQTINWIKIYKLGINGPISWTHRTQNISKNQNLYPQQSQITLFTLPWDTLYSVHYWNKVMKFLSVQLWIMSKCFFCLFLDQSNEIMMILPGSPFYPAKIWVGNCQPYPPATYAPDMNMLSSKEIWISIIGILEVQ